MITRPAITLCIINFNGVDHLRNAFRAIADFSGQFDEILVIDNGSTDDSVTFARSVNGVSVIQLAMNRGPGAARNLGFKLARNDLILFQDNDIILNPETAGLLADAIVDSPATLVAAPRVLYRDSPHIIQYDSADCHVLGMMVVRHANRAVAETSAQKALTSSLVTACFMLHRQRWAAMSAEGEWLFDESLVFNLEDHDFGVRANLLGHDIVSVPQACVLHGGGTQGLSWRPGYAVSSRRMFCLIRNRWWIVLRYFSLPTLIKLLPMLVLFELLQLAGMLRKGFAREWLQAFGSTLTQLPRLLRQRWNFQQRRKKTDVEMLRAGPLPLTVAMTAGSAAAFVIRHFDRIFNHFCLRFFPKLPRC
jgi:GT2 family glycosyltransferase